MVFHAKTLRSLERLMAQPPKTGKSSSTYRLTYIYVYIYIYKYLYIISFIYPLINGVIHGLNWSYIIYTHIIFFGGPWTHNSIYCRGKTQPSKDLGAWKSHDSPVILRHPTEKRFWRDRLTIAPAWARRRAVLKVWGRWMFMLTRGVGDPSFAVSCCFLDGVGTRNPKQPPGMVLKPCK